MGWLSAPPRDPASPLEIRLHSTDRGSDGSSPPGPSTDEPWIQLAALLRDHDGPEDIGRVAAVVSDGWGMRVKDATERWTMAFEEAGQLAGLMW